MYKKSTSTPLNNITLIAIGSTKLEETIAAINICKKYFKFKDIIYFSDKQNPYQYKIAPMLSIKDYDRFVVFDLPNIKFNTDFILTIHWDGFIVNPKAWTSKFLKYDYIGAPWPWLDNRVGNGGFCLKSKKFLDSQAILVSNTSKLEDPDDIYLSIKLRDQFIKLGCKYGDKIGYAFATEYGGYYQHHSFGFHDLKLNPQFKPLIYQSSTI
jgi:hypothetical protein